MRHFTFTVLGQALPVTMPDRPEDLREFMGWIDMQRGDVAVDTEGKGLDVLCGDPKYVRLVQFGTANEAWVIPVELGHAFWVAARDAILSLTSVVGHHFSFDALALAAFFGIDLDTLMRKSTDTQILTKLVDPRQPQEGGIGSALKTNSAYYIDPNAADTQGDLTAVFRSLGLTKATGWAGIDIFNPIYVSYAGGDVILTARLLPILRARLKQMGITDKLISYEHTISRICAHMQFKGMVLDQDYTRSLQSTLTDEAAEHSAIAARYGVESVNSTAQIAEALSAMGEAWPERTEGGKVAVDKNVLLRFADLDRDWLSRGTRCPNPLANAVLFAKRAGKWRSSYADTMLEVMDVNGRVHASVNSMEARTGRMSVRRPALQTLPSHDKMIRRAILADEGHVTGACDFQAIEMRVLAALADVKAMKQAINDGEDLHGFTARTVYGPDFTKDQRNLCKGVGFGKVYGGGAATIAKQTGAPEDDIRRAITAYDRVYPEIKRAGKRWQREAFDRGMAVVTPVGRRLPLDRDRTYAATNYMCQSTARDCLGQSLIHMEEAGLLPVLRLPVHDEVIFSAPKADATDIAREIERCMTFNLYGVPIEAKAKVGGRSWGSLYYSAEDKANGLVD